MVVVVAARPAVVRLRHLRPGIGGAAHLRLSGHPGMLFVMPHRRLLLALALVAGLAACRRAPVVEPTPQRRMASPAELAIYRVLTESTYVRSTGRPIAVVAT